MLQLLLSANTSQPTSEYMLILYIKHHLHSMYKTLFDYFIFLKHYILVENVLKWIA